MSQLRVVPAKVVPNPSQNWGRFKRLTTFNELKERAKVLYKNSPALQEKWMKAIMYLRNSSKTGWVGDELRAPESKA